MALNSPDDADLRRRLLEEIERTREKESDSIAKGEASFYAWLVEQLETMYEELVRNDTN